MVCVGLVAVLALGFWSRAVSTCVRACMAAFWIATSKLGSIGYRHLKLDLTRNGDDVPAQEIDKHVVKPDVFPPWMHQKAALTGVPIQGYGNRTDDFQDGIDVIALVRVASRGSSFTFVTENSKQTLFSNANQTQMLHL